MIQVFILFIPFLNRENSLTILKDMHRRIVKRNRSNSRQTNVAGKTSFWGGPFLGEGCFLTWPDFFLFLTWIKKG